MDRGSALVLQQRVLQLLREAVQRLLAQDYAGTEDLVSEAMVMLGRLRGIDA